MVKKQTKKDNSSKVDSDSKLFAFLAAFLTIVGFVIALILKRDNKYVMFYAKQGLVLFIIQIVAWVVAMLPLIGWIASSLIWIIFIICWILAWVNALSGDMKDTWLIGEFAKKINL